MRSLRLVRTALIVRTLSIAVLALAVVAGNAVAQTAAEQRAILRGFERVVFTYVEQPDSPVVFTLPVSLVFRHLIATALGQSSVPTMSGPPGRLETQIAANDPWPPESSPLPDALLAMLPVLPPILEYRFVNRDLVLLDTQRRIVVAVLRDAVGRAHTTTQHH